MNKLKGFLEQKEGEIIGIASTESPDRDGEVIKQDGWDLTNFKSNPVLLASHNYHEFPIGKATDIAIQDGKLIFKAIFSEATEKAKEAYALVKEGILSAFSVGFIPREYDSKEAGVITKAELLEISLVAVPANPQAVVLAKSFSESNKENELAKELVRMWEVKEAPLDEVSETEEAEEVEPQEVELGEDKTVKCDCGKTYIIKLASEDGNVEVGEEGEKVDGSELDIKVLQRATGYLQELLHNLKKGKEDRI
jgi:HK97 family phage prohead protease